MSGLYGWIVPDMAGCGHVVAYIFEYTVRVPRKELKKSESGDWFVLL